MEIFPLFGRNNRAGPGRTGPLGYLAGGLGGIAIWVIVFFPFLLLQAPTVPKGVPGQG